MKSIALDFKNNMICFMTAGQQGTETNPDLKKIAFVGFTYMSDAQKKDMERIFPGVKNLDFVCGWYKKANDYIKNTKIECGFVSTNSIIQGETVARLWKFLDFKINYAYQTFIWDSEANAKAHVHCVIIGFADFDRKTKILYSNGTKSIVSNINPYLMDAPNVIVESRNTPLCNVSKMVYGNKPADGGYLIIEDEDYTDFITRDPNSKKFIRPLLGAVEFLHNKKRWCLWLKGASPSELKNCPLVMERIAKCKENRDPLTMPPELQKAHNANNKAVMQAYGFSVKDTSETDCVEALMRMYEKLTK